MVKTSFDALMIIISRHVLIKNVLALHVVVTIDILTRLGLILRAVLLCFSGDDAGALMFRIHLFLIRGERIHIIFLNAVDTHFPVIFHFDTVKVKVKAINWDTVPLELVFAVIEGGVKVVSILYNIKA